MVVLCVTRKFSASVLTKHISLSRNIGLSLDRFVLRAQFSSSTIKSKPPSLLLLTFVGAGAGVAIGGGYSLYVTQKARLPISNKDTGAISPILKKHPEVNISRRVYNEADASGLQLTLFQYPTCPFCCKVRAFLNFYGISYDVVEVNPVLRQQMSWSDYKKVPIVLAKVQNGYQQLNDSSMIISALSTYLEESQPDLSKIISYYPSVTFRDDAGKVKNEVLNRYFVMFKEENPRGRTKEEMEEERTWRKWADNVLVHTLSPNVYRTREEALQAFFWFSEVGEWDRLFPSWERNLIVYVGAVAMHFIGKRLKKRHNLKEDVRQSLYDECNVWMRALKKKNSTFMGGDSPNLADLAVYGVLSSIEGCDAFQDLLHNTKIGLWYWPIKKMTQGNMGTTIS